MKKVQQEEEEEGFVRSVKCRDKLKVKVSTFRGKVGVHLNKPVPGKRYYTYLTPYELYDMLSAKDKLISMVEEAYKYLQENLCEEMMEEDDDDMEELPESILSQALEKKQEKLLKKMKKKRKKIIEISSSDSEEEEERGGGGGKDSAESALPTLFSEPSTSKDAHRN